MMLRVQLERQHEAAFSANEYFQFYGLRLEHMSRAKPDAIVMHPGPINRGREISSEVADSQRSVILNQVENGIAVRMAVLERILGNLAGENSDPDFMSKLIIRNGRVMDPASRSRRCTRHSHRKRPHRRHRPESRYRRRHRTRCHRPHRRAWLHRHARPSARARLRTRRNHRERLARRRCRWIHLHLLHAKHFARQRQRHRHQLYHRACGSATPWSMCFPSAPSPREARANNLRPSA